MIREVKKDTIEVAMRCVKCYKQADWIREPIDGDAWCEECAIAAGLTLMMTPSELA